MYSYKPSLYILILCSNLSLQSADWLSENLKPAIYLSFPGIGATCMWYEKAITPAMALYQKANRLLEDRFALNRSESDWNLGGSLVYDISAQEYDALLADVNLSPKMIKSYENKRVNMFLEENLTPERLRALKDKIIMSCALEYIDQKKLLDYTDELQTTINELQPQNMWQELAQKKADQELVQRLSYKYEQMIAFKEILYAKKAADHKKKLEDMFGVN